MNKERNIASGRVRQQTGTTVNTRAGQVPANKRRGNSPDIVRSSDKVLYRGTVDIPLLILIIITVCFGTVMVFSSSYSSAYYNRGNSYYYILSHLRWIAIGGVAMFLASIVDYRIYRRFTLPVYVVCVVLLALVPFLGFSKGEATRWIYIGSVRLQPSEVMKLGQAMMLALYYSSFERIIDESRGTPRHSLYSFWIPFFIVTINCMLIILENHFSGTIIMFAIGLLVMFSAGAEKKWFAIGGSVSLGLITLLIRFSSYAKQRVDIYIHPEAYDSLDEVWQTIQGLYAVGSGGLFGLGLGNGTQKQLFVAEAYNDFIYSIICEELGFLGAIAVIVLFILILLRGVHIALHAPDTYSRLLVIGIIGKVILEAVLNIAVVTSLIPNTGVTLPFFSYGGTAFMMLLGEMGMVLSISRYTYHPASKQDAGK